MKSKLLLFIVSLYCVFSLCSCNVYILDRDTSDPENPTTENPEHEDPEHEDLAEHIHAFSNYVSNGDATCTADGTKTAKCEKCNITNTEIDKNSKLEHCFLVYVSDNNADWGVDGTMTSKCDFCDATDTITVAGSGLYSFGLEFSLNEDEASYSVSGVGAETSNIIYIPPVYEGLPVTNIGRSAFSSGVDIESIIIPDSVIDIGFEAFVGCIELKNIEIPDSITNIGQWALSYCGNLDYNEYDNAYYLGNENNPYVVLVRSKDTSIKSCIINDGCKIIYQDSFSGCEELADIVIPNGIISIGQMAFCGCTNLKAIELPHSITKMGYSTFKNCTAITNVTVGDGLTCLGSSAFEGCISLSTVELGNSITKIDYNAFRDCTKLDKIEVPNCVTTIGSSAFEGCTSLVEVKLGSGLTDIDYYAFKECIALTSIDLPDSLINIKPLAFSGCTNLEFTEFDNAYYIGNKDNPYFLLVQAKNSLIQSCEINSKTRIIGGGAFSGCVELATIDVPNGVVGISQEAFYSCYSLKSITIPESVKIIGALAFSDCTGIALVTLPDSITKIEDGAFQNCSELREITISNKLDSIPPSMFSGCTALESINIPDSVTAIHASAFQDCKSIKKLCIPDCVETIGDFAFYGCAEITSVIIGNGVKNIGSCAFAYCGNIEEIIVDSENAVYQSVENCLIDTNGKILILGCKNSLIPTDGTVIMIGESSFSGCKDLLNIEIPDSVISIGDSAFDGCTKLKYDEYDNAYYLGNTSNPYLILVKAKNTLITSCKIHENTKVINFAAFDQHTKLKSVEVANKLTHIGEYAFHLCRAFESITYAGTIEEWVNVEKSNIYYGWDNGTGDYTVYCTDGTIAKDGTVIYYDS